jgi:uncharacterized protein YicC (UPF0701 family)
MEKSDLFPIDNIIELADEIIDDCPSCSAKASEIIHWAKEVRERRPNREELTALVDAACKGALTNTQRADLIEGMQALVRVAE